MIQRFGNLWKAFWNKILSGAEKRNAKELLDQEKENLRTMIAKYNEQLAVHAGMLEKLKIQIQRGQKELEQLEPRVLVANESGDTAHASELAGRYNKLETELAANNSQLADAEKIYQELTKTRDVSIKQVKDKIDGLMSELSQTEMAEAQASLNEMATSTIAGIGGAGDNLSRIGDQISDRKTVAMGRARVARDGMAGTFRDIEETEKEEKAMNGLALAKFLAKRGVTPPASTVPAATAGQEAAVPAAPARTMGPEKDAAPASA